MGQDDLLPLEKVGIRKFPGGGMTIGKLRERPQHEIDIHEKAGECLKHAIDCHALLDLEGRGEPFRTVELKAALCNAILAVQHLQDLSREVCGTTVDLREAYKELYGAAADITEIL